ncbi:hypothetical protein [Selenomonas sp.]|uniref:hypothetical protein n=1 Tax=Selenomonas sp. TaxID=2053611 RepID=UPI0025FACB90|nr:hypothetical protein [Selenomonas sp.]MCI6283566.1 hypothetical protein [Selenomonas sp.]
MKFFMGSSFLSVEVMNLYEDVRAPATSKDLQTHSPYKRPAPGAALRSAPVLYLKDKATTSALKRRVSAFP